MSVQKHRQFGLFLAACGLLTVVIVLLAAQPGRAAGPWYVTTSGNDGNDCLSPASPCATINGALGKASAGDTIYVAIGTYTGSGDEVVILSKSITLSGGWDEGFATQSGMSTVDGEGARRGLTVDGSITVVIEHLTAINGTAEYDGGGIHNFEGALTVNSSIVSGNEAESDGGGILNHGALTLNSSTVNGNSAWNGGGIANSGTLTLHNCTVSGNMGGQGGGVFNSGGGTLHLINGTISGNTASYGGGGVCNMTSTVILQNTVLAGNRSLVGPDCSCDPIGSAGHNLIGDTSGCVFTVGPGDLTNADPELGELLGTPAYRPLRPGSPAIDAGPLDECILSMDQCGVGRPQGLACDIGAYEYTIPGPAARVSAYDGTPQRTPPYSAFWIPLRAAVLDDIGSPVSNATVTFSAPKTGPSGTLADTGTTMTTVESNDNGIAVAATLTANGLAGAYPATATVRQETRPASG